MLAASFNGYALVAVAIVAVAIVLVARIIARLMHRDGAHVAHIGIFIERHRASESDWTSDGQVFPLETQAWPPRGEDA